MSSPRFSTQEIPVIDITCSEQSLGVSNVYIKDKALNIFLHENEYGENFGIVAAYPCLQEYRYVAQEDADHESYHLSTQDFETPHYHILKGKTEYSEMTLDDIKCLMNQFHEFQRVSGLCQDGKTECSISEVDRNRIISAYENYLKQKAATERPVYMDAIVAELTKGYSLCAKSFASTFLSVLIDNYIIRLLINNGVDHGQARWSMEVTKGIMKKMLSCNFWNLMLGRIVCDALTNALLKHVINQDKIEQINYAINAVVSFADNPLSLIEMGLAGSAATAGRSAAYPVIRALPKLRVEPVVNEQHTGEPIVLGRSNLPTTGELRRRGI